MSAGLPNRRGGKTASSGCRTVPDGSGTQSKESKGVDGSSSKNGGHCRHGSEVSAPVVREELSKGLLKALGQETGDFEDSGVGLLEMA